MNWVSSNKTHKTNYPPYLLLAIYCYKHYREKVSIKRVRELRIRIQNEARNVENDLSGSVAFKNQKDLYAYAKT